MVYNKEYVKQKTKSSSKRSTTERAVSLVGRKLDEYNPVFPYLAQLSSSPGWHRREGVIIHVATNAKSFRTPTARFDPMEFPLRTSYARFDERSGKFEWRILEESETYGELRNC